MRAALLILLSLPLAAQTVDIGVFTLFRPVDFRVSPASRPILIAGPGTHEILEGRQSFAIHIAQSSTPIRVSARDGSATDFHLAIPGKIDRQFHGILTVRAVNRKLQAVITMDPEIAVASVVAAEMTPNTPLEALKAQAVAARSYFAAAGRRHDGFDFCDTTHCQFLRAWPHRSSTAYRAAQQTRGLVLEYDGKPLAAMYSASCGGRTRALDGEVTGYPYYAVDCDYCRRHSHGQVRGHQLGLCQNGASGMAAEGATFQSILDHYFPGVTLNTANTALLGFLNSSPPTFLLPLSPPLRHSKD